MASPPFPPRPSCQDDLHGSGRGHPRAPPNTPIRPQLPTNDTLRTPRGILRPTPSLYTSTPHDPTSNPQILRPQPPPPIPRSTTAPQHHHTSSSPELRPRADNAWAPRVHQYSQHHPSDLSQTVNTPNPSYSSSHIVTRPRADQDDTAQRRSGFAARFIPHFVPGIRGRSASDIRITRTPPPDLDPDRLARACGQTALTSYRHDDRGRQGIPVDAQQPRVQDQGTVRSADSAPSHPPLPKIRVSHMYRRLDALARRSGRRAMDYVGFQDVAVVHHRDNHLREQLRRKRSDRLQEKDPNFHAIGAPLEDVLLYASTAIVIGDYHYHLPIVVVACIEELTKTGIYQSGLFRALPSRDRHLQLIDLFDKSPDFGAHFNMRGQTMPDVCALLSTFISSLPAPLLDTHIYAALWHWSVKPSVKREDARRDQQEEEEEDRRARGEIPQSDSWMTRTDIFPNDADTALETDQISIAQILLRFLPSANLSLLVYLCGFFTQLPLCPENGLQLEDVARIFGHRLLGGSNKAVSQRMMLWLLTRWHRTSETLFGDMCGMTPPPSPSDAPQPRTSVVVGERSNEQVAKGKGKRESGADDMLRYTASSSSSHSSTLPESPEERSGSSRKSSSDCEEEGEGSGESRRRKKRELDVQEARANGKASRPSSSRKESRHGHGQGRRGSGSRHHHHGHLSEHRNAPTSPDPFAMGVPFAPEAFAKAQQDLADAPFLTTSTSVPPGGEGGNESRASRPQFETSNQPHLDTPARTTQVENDREPTDVDIHTLLRETAVATDTARALAERVEVLERVLQVRQKEGQAERHTVHHMEAGAGGLGDGDRKGDVDRDTEDRLRIQLQFVEAERDEARRIVHDMRAYLLDGGTTQQ